MINNLKIFLFLSMGNTFKGDHKGIVDYGREEDYNCIDCGVEFKRHVGMITIKGPAHPQERCLKCHGLYQDEYRVHPLSDDYCNHSNKRERKAIFSSYILPLDYKDYVTSPKSHQSYCGHHVELCVDCEEKACNDFPVVISDWTQPQFLRSVFKE